MELDMGKLAADWLGEQPTQEEWLRVEEAVNACRQKKSRQNMHTTTGDVYAYPHPGGGIAWGINGGTQGFCIARGKAA